MALPNQRREIMTEDRPTMYNVAFSYDFSTISVGVVAPDEELAEEEAIEILVDEWGPGIRDYSSCDITEIN
jgi:hypothetical protein